MFDELKNNLINKGYRVSIFNNKLEASSYLTNEIHGKSVGMGGSITIKEMGLFESLKNNNTVWWHNDPNQVKEYGANYIRGMAMTTDIYISSVNGISKDGVIVNLDGPGNRVSSIAYGHKKVYLIVGINKVCDTLEDTIYRVRNVAAPFNAKRLNKKTPCAINGDKCYDCKSPERICRTLSISLYPTSSCETEVILINEKLGC